MVTEMLEILETAVIAASGFLIKKYVFLEPDMETKKQHIFYQVSFLLIGIVFWALGKDTASLAALFILFYVKGRGWRSWFHENMQHRSLRKSEKYLLWVIGILMLLFSNHTAMQITLDGGSVRAADSMYGRGLAPFIGITSVSAFVMTITIIVLIMQGNMRSFYHEAKNEAVRANEAKSHFLSNMSHEIRTPINAILGMNEMISQGMPGQTAAFLCCQYSKRR